MKHCPISIGEGGCQFDCTEKDCAWWDETGESCAVLSISKGIDILTDIAFKIECGNEAKVFIPPKKRNSQ